VKKVVFKNGIPVIEEVPTGVQEIKSVKAVA